MTHRPACVASPFVGGVDEAAMITGLEQILSGATTFNVAYLRQHPDTPTLAESGMLYRFKGAGLRKEVRTIPFLLEDGEGDCAELACWYAADCIVRGGDTKARVRLQRQTDDPDEVVYHALVATRRGWVDPSAYLLVRNG